MGQIITKRIFISGRVQGVSFRHHACEMAREMGLVGFVRNLSDGRVEIFAQGEGLRIDGFLEWCWNGSPESEVKDVSVEDASHLTYTEFIIESDSVA